MSIILQLKKIWNPFFPRDDTHARTHTRLCKCGGCNGSVTVTVVESGSSNLPFLDSSPSTHQPLTPSTLTEP